jgi:cytochrome o ubiquinol oxidase subunit 2
VTSLAIRWLRKARRLAPFAAAGLLGGCNWVVLDPKGQIGRDERSILILATALMLLVVIPVIAMIFAFAWKYRASNQAATYAPEWDRSLKVAGVVVLIPLLIVLGLSVITWRSTHALDPYRPLESAVKPINIEVVALNWKWLFIYPDLHIATVNEIAFPTNTPVNFTITSASVMNSFFIPQLGGQIYAMAGMQTKLSLIADQAGTYDGMSANYSGGGFSDMKFQALALSDREFQAWVGRVRRSPQRLGSVTYKALARPSERTPVGYFSSADDDLFQTVIGSFRGPSTLAANQHGADPSVR